MLDCFHRQRPADQNSILSGFEPAYCTIQNVHIRPGSKYNINADARVRIWPTRSGREHEYDRIMT